MVSLYYFLTFVWLFSDCHGTPTSTLHKRQNLGPYYAITGARDGVHPRLEIRELEKTGPMWNLFLLALSEFQAIDQNEIDSYYQIAGKSPVFPQRAQLNMRYEGIHGMPWYDWDGVVFNTSNGKPPMIGYCPHRQLLFSMWHRPYLLLFEQKLQDLAIEIATRFANDPSYQDAANRLRLPYWDSAATVPANDPAFPAALSTPMVTVTFPGGSTQKIHNPLYDYEFHPLDHTQLNSSGCNFGQNAKICNTVSRTIRKATNDAKDASDHDALNAALQSQQPSLRRMIYDSITKYRTFNNFSSDGTCGGGTSPTSIEAPHNIIHAIMDPGHMSPPPVAAFDPVFWLHHANVDRHIALFQALFPDTFVERCSAGNAYTWTIPMNSVLNVDTPLTPFHRTASGEFWTPTSSKNIDALGYTYPELFDIPTNETLISRINALYRDSRLAAGRAAPKDVDYFVQVTMPASAQSYNVVLFLGDVHEDPRAWNSQASFVSRTSSLAVMAGQGSSSTLGMVVLSDVIDAKMTKGNIERAQVVNYLETNLKWRLELGDEEIPRNSVPGVKVTLMSTEVERATSMTEFDRWVGDFKMLGDIL